MNALILSRLIFCFKQKTAYEMRISDWSSDVCSSDLFAVSGPRSGVCVTDSVLPDVTERLRFAAKARRWRYRSLRFQKKGKLRLGSCLSDLPWFLVNRYRPESLPRRFAAFTARPRLVVTGRYHKIGRAHV